MPMEEKTKESSQKAHVLNAALAVKPVAKDAESGSTIGLDERRWVNTVRGRLNKLNIIEFIMLPPLTEEGVSDYLIQGKTGEIPPRIVEEVKRLRRKVV